VGKKLAAVRVTLPRVQPKALSLLLTGAWEHYSVRYGSDRTILFIGRGDEASTAFESTLAGLVGREGQTMSSLRSGRALLVWERPTYAPAIDGCLD
jgi:hypothetical protein